MYAFSRDETVGDAVRRILVEQVDRAIAQLADAKQKPAKRIHDARKRFKEIRAVLRMVRLALGEQFAVENVWFRDAGREIGAIRDAEALVEAAAKLRQSAPALSDKRLLARVRGVLAKRRDAAIGADIEGRIANLLEQLPVAKARLANLTSLDDRFATIGAGLERTYACGRTAYRRASLDPAVEEIHEWRKRVKDHWYHVQLLRHVWPEIMKTYGDVMAELSSTLGDRHDLDMLRALIEREPTEFGSPRRVRHLLDAIDARRGELFASALAVGSRVYSEDPASWRARVRGYWRSWRGGSSGG